MLHLTLFIIPPTAVLTPPPPPTTHLTLIIKHLFTELMLLYFPNPPLTTPPSTDGRPQKLLQCKHKNGCAYLEKVIWDISLTLGGVLRVKIVYHG